MSSTMPSATNADLSNIKTENGDTGRAMRDVKMESEASSSHVDEDIYEDAGDLDFTDAAQALYLTRLPKYLWKAWAQLEDHEEVQIGTIRVEGSLEKLQRMSLMLAESIFEETVPKEYNLKITNPNTVNTFVFTEKDFPGFSQRARDSMRPSQGEAPFSQAAPRLPFNNRGRLPGTKVDKGRRFYSHQRRAIPIVGQAKTEISCLPVENDEYHRIMDRRAMLEELKPKRETQLLDKNVPGGNNLHPGTLGNSGSFTAFIKPTSSQRVKGQDVKALRMPQNELLDSIFECFRKYNYWTLRNLKAELNQPENYLKETLQRVAQTVNGGPFHGHYQLKPDAKIPEYFDLQDFAKARDQAPDITAGFDGAPDGVVSDDEENIKMEDVKPT